MLESTAFRKDKPKDHILKVWLHFVLEFCLCSPYQHEDELSLLHFKRPATYRVGRNLSTRVKYAAGLKNKVVKKCPYYNDE